MREQQGAVQLWSGTGMTVNGGCLPSAPELGSHLGVREEHRGLGYPSSCLAQAAITHTPLLFPAFLTEPVQALGVVLCPRLEEVCQPSLTLFIGCASGVSDTLMSCAAPWAPLQSYRDSSFCL